MTTLVVGDVHGCAAELRDLLDATGPDRVVLVGDLFTKGPDPAGVWATIRDHGLGSVLGNHDERLLRGRARDRDAARCAALLDRADPDWRPWLQDRPLFLDLGGWTVVHAGLHPSGDRASTTRKMALTLRRWPEERDTDPFWWEVYQGEAPVVFGHDARRGLVRVDRHGLPWLRGLDTGCVYGGRLSGWIAEEDRVVQVEARRAWHPVG